MRVYVNDRPVDLVPGMTVRHALVAAGRIKEIEAGKKTYDPWGHEVGLDGALSEGERIWVK
jgi:hypothetical protein